MREKTITIAGESRKVSIAREDGLIRATVGDDEVVFREIARSDEELVIEIDGRHINIPWVRTEDGAHFSIDGSQWQSRTQKAGRGRSGGDAGHSLSAPMPGTVLSIKVSEGDPVSKGDTLLVLEAMKMEHQITAPWDGIVDSIGCTEGEMVQPGIDLISVDPISESGETS